MPTREDLTLLEQEGLTMAQAARMFPSGTAGKRLNPTTVWRWCLKGARRGIRLQSVVIGTRRYTTRTWLQDFIEARTLEATPEGRIFPHIRTSGQRQRAAERVGKRLDAILWPPKKKGSTKAKPNSR
jgi:hypothetical protein